MVDPLDNQPPGKLGHALSFEFLWLPQLDSQIKQTQRRNGTQTEGNAPGSTHVLFRKDQHENHRHKGRENSSKVDLEVGEEDKPPVPMAALELAGAKYVVSRA